MTTLSENAKLVMTEFKKVVTPAIYGATFEETLKRDPVNLGILFVKYISGLEEKSIIDGTTASELELVFVDYLQGAK